MKRSLCNVCVGNLAREEEQEDDCNVAPTEAELRSILNDGGRGQGSNGS